MFLLHFLRKLPSNFHIFSFLRFWKNCSIYYLKYVQYTIQTGYVHSQPDLSIIIFNRISCITRLTVFLFIFYHISRGSRFFIHLLSYITRLAVFLFILLYIMIRLYHAYLHIWIFLFLHLYIFLLIFSTDLFLSVLLEKHILPWADILYRLRLPFLIWKKPDCINNSGTIVKLAALRHISKEIFTSLNNHCSFRGFHQTTFFSFFFEIDLLLCHSQVNCLLQVT